MPKCFKILVKISEENFPIPSYPIIRISGLVYPFWGIHELKASLVEGQQLQQKDKKRRKWREKNGKPKRVGIVDSPETISKF